MTDTGDKMAEWGAVESRWAARTGCSFFPSIDFLLRNVSSKQAPGTHSHTLAVGLNVRGDQIFLYAIRRWKQFQTFEFCAFGRE